MVDCTGLENRRRETVREFESHRFRQFPGGVSTGIYLNPKEAAFNSALGAAEKQSMQAKSSHAQMTTPTCTKGLCLR